jgi:hypothetical protein
MVFPIPFHSYPLYRSVLLSLHPLSFWRIHPGTSISNYYWCNWKHAT